MKVDSYSEERTVMERELAKRVKLCMNCEHYRYISFSGSNQCMHNSNLAKSMENGALYPRWSAHALRENDAKCGVEAKWFEQKK
jgi:hypothetical protein